MITIVGAGALGSHLALFLRNTEHVITLVDFDRVEMKNTHSQFHTRMGVGKSKVFALSQTFMGLFGRRLEILPYRLTSDNVSAILKPKDTDLVVDCTDNIATRELIQEHCMMADIPCLHGCLSADGTFARIVWTENFTADPEGEEGEATCEDGEHLPFYAVAASYLAVEAQLFLKHGRKRCFHVTPHSAITC